MTFGRFLISFFSVKYVFFQFDRNVKVYIYTYTHTLIYMHQWNDSNKAYF